MLYDLMHVINDRHYPTMQFHLQISFMYRDADVKISPFYSIVVFVVIFAGLKPSSLQNMMTGSWFHASHRMLCVPCRMLQYTERSWLIDGHTNNVFKHT